MKSSRWAWSLAAVLTLAGESRAQFLLPPLGYGYGGGLGFGFRGHHFALNGFAGYGGYGLGFPFGPFGYGPYGGSYINRVTIVTPPTVVIAPNRLRQREPDDYDVSGVDLDVVHPKSLELPRGKVILREPPPVDLPGVDVSVPKKPVRPGDQPPPPARKIEPPPQPPRAPAGEPPGLPPPKDNPAEEVLRLLDIGVAAFQQQLYGVAAQRFRQATVVDPKEARAYFYLSQADLALGKYRDAATAIRQGMRLHPAWPDQKIQPRKALYKDHDDFTQHVRRLEDALVRDPQNADFLFLLGHTLWFDGRRAEAVALFRRARPLTADPAFIDMFLRAAAAPGLVAVK